MISISLKYSFVVLFLITLATACKKDHSPDKSTFGHGKISYFAKASSSGMKTSAVKSNGILSNPVTVEWSSASIYIEKMSFVGKSSSLLDTTILVEKNMDLFSADALAGTIQLPSGSYKDVKVKLFLRKHSFPQLAFYLKGTFINTQGTRDSLLVASSIPFEINLDVTDITIDPSDTYKATFNFDLNKGLAGISTEALQTARRHVGTDNKVIYSIWKGGSQDEPFYDQVVENWQNVASVVMSKQ